MMAFGGVRSPCDMFARNSRASLYRSNLDIRLSDSQALAGSSGQGRDFRNAPAKVAGYREC